MDEILLFLLKKGAYQKPIRVTTIELGTATAMSQQSASRKLLILENEGYLTRNGQKIKLTKKAYEEMAKIYASLREVFERTSLEISGTIVKGRGEGKFYLSLQGYIHQVESKLGFKPYPGTLNIRLDENERWKKQLLLQMEPIMIDSFREGDKTYGDLFAYHCNILDEKCAVILPLRTHHGVDIIEIIAKDELRKKLNKTEGDKIKVII